MSKYEIMIMAIGLTTLAFAAGSLLWVLVRDKQYSKRFNPIMCALGLLSTLSWASIIGISVYISAIQFIKGTL